MGERIRVRWNDSVTRKDFVAMYNRFVRQKHLLARPLSTTRIANLNALAMFSLPTPMANLRLLNWSYVMKMSNEQTALSQSALASIRMQTLD
jgi:hypothetical protein